MRLKCTVMQSYVAVFILSWKCALKLLSAKQVYPDYFFVCFGHLGIHLTNKMSSVAAEVFIAPNVCVLTSFSDV